VTGTAPTEGRVARPDGGGAAAAVPPYVARKGRSQFNWLLNQ